MVISSAHPNWFELAMGLMGGLALFLFGLDQLSVGLKQAAGDTLKTLLTRLTSNRFLGALTGALVTGILNSSSVTTVLVVGFVTAGVMSLTQSVAVIMGSNIGSTVTAQILAFNLSAYALCPVAIGFFMLFAGKRDVIRHSGMMVMGLGLVFFGMGVMSEAMTPLRSYAPFVQALAGMEKPLYGILAGAVFTGAVQSSAATVGIAIAMASEGLLTLPAGIALALGSNIGTCVTALLAALGKPVEAVRAAAVHVVFNVLGVLLWLPFIGVLARLATALSPDSAGLEGVDRLAAEVPRQIANANTLFNVVNTAIFIGFTGWFAQLTTWLISDRKEEATPTKPHFLDAVALSVPAVALEQVRQELGRLGDIVRAMLVEFPARANVVVPETMAGISTCRDEVRVLEGAILEFLGRIRQGNLTRQESDVHIALMTITVHFRSLADVIADDLADIARNAASELDHPPTLERAVLSDLYQAVQRSVGLAVQAVRRRDVAAAAAVLAMSDEIRQLADSLMSRLAAGLDDGGPQNLATLRLQTTFVEGLRHVFTLAKRIARSGDLPL